MAEEKQRKRLALVVGVNYAPQSLKAPLQFAEKDAKDLADVLQQPPCKFTSPVVLIGEQAKSWNIRQTLLTLLNNLEDGDLLLIHFSLHGIAMKLRDDSEEVFLGTSDFDRMNAASDPSSYLPLSWLKERCYSSDVAGNVILLLDCCHAGAVAESSVDSSFRNSLDFNQLRTILMRNFVLRGNDFQLPLHSLRRILVATSPNNTAAERDGHGVMTGLIIEALQGKEPDAINNSSGQITATRLHDFLKQRMQQIGVKPPDLLGTDADQSCWLALYDPATVRASQQRPALLYFVPREHSSHFQLREGEFAHLLSWLKAAPGKPLGLIGMPGIGKSELAGQFAFAHKSEFPDGIYWIDASDQVPSENRLDAWRTRFASLARKLDYRPSPGQNDEESLAPYLAVYLARSQQALLILDGVEEPREITKLLTSLAGRPMECALLYTSVDPYQSEDLAAYRVPILTDSQAYHLLLPDQRSGILRALLQGQQINDEAAATRAICGSLANHPLALTVLRAFLNDEPDLTLRLLADELGQRDFFELTKEAQISASVLDMFALVWKRIGNPEAEWLFKLLAYYPESAAIPLWLAGLAAGLKMEGGVFSPLHNAWKRLHSLSLVTYVPALQLLQFHPMLRAFGKSLTSRAEEKAGLREAGQQLANVLGDLSRLEARARLDYWTCLDQFRAAISYIRVLADGNTAGPLVPIERALERESYLLASGDFWPEHFPALFYQQIANRLPKQKDTAGPQGNPPQDVWLSLLRRLRTGSTSERQRILRGHTKEVTTVAFSPDGAEILTASEDGEAHILDASSGRVRVGWQAHSQGITSAAFAPDGTSLLTAARDGTVLLWRWERAFLLTQEIARFPHPTEVSCVAFAPDGHSFLSGAHDGLARLWDCETGEVVQTFVGHHQAITSVAFAPDGQTVLTGSWDLTTRLWERASGRELQVFSAEIRYEFPYTPYFANGLTGQKISQPVIESVKSEERFVTSVAFSPHGRFILVGYNDGRAWLWEISSGQIVRAFDHPLIEVASVAFSPDGRFILTGTGDGAVRVFAVETGHLLTMFRASGRIKSTVFSPDGTNLLAGSNDHQVRLWSIPDQVLKNQRMENQSPLIFVTRVALGTVKVIVQGQTRLMLKVLAGFENGEVWLWEQTTRGSLRLAAQMHAHHSSVTSVAFAEQGQTFLVGYENGIVQRWEVLAQAQTRALSFQHQLQHDQQVTATLYVPDHRSMLSASQDGKAYVWTSRKGPEADLTVTHPADYSGPITCAAVSHDGLHLLLGLADGQIILTATKRKNEKLRWQGHTGALTGLAFLPGNRYVITSGTDTRTCLWDSQDGTLVGELAEQTDEVQLFAFSLQGNLLLACNNRGNLARLWTIDLSGPVPICTLLAVYSTHYRIGTALWLNQREFILADTGDTSCRPSFYWVRVENVT